MTHHHVIGFGDVYFKLKPSTLVVTLIWKQIEEERQRRGVFINLHTRIHQFTISCGDRGFNHDHTILIRV